MVAAAAVAMGSPASAADDPPDVTGISVANVRVASNDCLDIPVTFRFADHGWRVDGINAWVSYHGEHVGYLGASPEDDQASTARTTARWCASSGLGRYVVGPSQITYHNPQGAGVKHADDATTTVFHVRRAARVKPLEQTASSVTAVVRAYSLKAGHYTAAAQVVVKLQRHAASGWRTVSTGNTGEDGHVTLQGTGGRLLTRATSTIAKAKARL